MQPTALSHGFNVIDTLHNFELLGIQSRESRCDHGATEHVLRSCAQPFAVPESGTVGCYKLRPNTINAMHHGARTLLWGSSPKCVRSRHTARQFTPGRVQIPKTYLQVSNTPHPRREQ